MYNKESVATSFIAWFGFGTGGVLCRRDPCSLKDARGDTVSLVVGADEVVVANTDGTDMTSRKVYLSWR
ncbi:hypothetical protein QVD17_17202 [Tagetes erecta]|uniref:Uncharacterized protein n=1 Tax=Tagetes erecta TaxID=13708 RepID=A0AAD8KRV4_TARER|nr:hypothetical protein QVD17_17202 [Tagetes erecta]